MLTKHKSKNHGKETGTKQRQLRQILRGHRKQVTGVYVYIDANGGRGKYPMPSGGFCEGSPVVAYEELQAHGGKYQAFVFEKDFKNFLALMVEMRTKYPKHDLKIHNMDNGNAAALVAATAKSERGLAYFDPPGFLDVKTVVDCVRENPGLDILIRLQPTTYKRVRGVHGKSDPIKQILKAINKKHIYLTRPATAHQWCFLLASDEPLDVPNFFHEVGEEEDNIGKQILIEITKVKSK